VFPKSGLVLLRGKAGRTREVLLGEEEGVNRNVACDLEILLLAEGDEEDVVFGLNVRDVNTAVVETGEEED